MTCIAPLGLGVFGGGSLTQNEVSISNDQTGKRDYKEKKVLKLTLSRKPFEVMVTGEKAEEYRTSSDWIKSRLIDKKGNPRHYDFIEFVNGYGSDKPYFVCKFLGWTYVDRDQLLHYSNGLTFTVNIGDFAIGCGKVLEKGHLK